MALSDLREFISAQRAQGVGDDQIRSTLTQKGWKQSLIDEAFSQGIEITPPSSRRMGIWPAFILAIKNPHQLFVLVGSAPLKDAFFYFGFFVLAPAIINLATTAVYLQGISWIAPQVLMAAGLSVVALLIVSALTHGACRLLRGKGPYAHTLKALIYGSSPSLAVNILGIVLGPIDLATARGYLLAAAVYKPLHFIGAVITLIAAVWSLITIVGGLRYYHSISTFRSIVALIVPTLIILLGILGLFLYFFWGFY